MTTAVHYSASRTVQAPARPRPWLLVVMPLGPLAVGVLRYLLPYQTTDSAGAMVKAVFAQPGRESIVLWLSLLAVLTLVPGVQAAARLAGPTRLCRVALSLVVPAYLCLGALTTGDAILWSGQHAGLDQQSVTRVVSAGHPSLMVATAVFVIGHVLGTVLLGLALLHSGRIPSWAAILVVVSQPLHFIAAVVLGSHELDLFAWCLTAVGMAVAAQRIRTPSRSMRALDAVVSPLGSRPYDHLSESGGTHDYRVWVGYAESGSGSALLRRRQHAAGVTCAGVDGARADHRC